MKVWHLSRIYITVPVSNIVPSMNDVIINQIFIAIRRQRRDVQLIAHAGENKAESNPGSGHTVRSSYKTALIWFCQNCHPSNSVDKFIRLQSSAKETINVEIYLLYMIYMSLMKNVFIFSRPCS